MKTWIILILSFCLASCVASKSGLAPVESKSFYATGLTYAKGGAYVVQTGDTLYSIAFRAGTNIAKLAQLNHLKEPYTIYPGQYLIVQDSNVKKSFRKNKKNVKKDLALKANSRLSSHSKKSTKKDKVVKHRVRWGWPTEGTLTKRFGQSQRLSKGIEFSGPLGMPVVAAARGEVVYAGNALRGYGNLVIIKHSDDYLSAYAHNHRILVRTKQKVKKGQHIADMGKSGVRTVKLHFEVRYHGKSVDPLKYLPPQSM
tara:strand:+ start:3730 stop:4497 length:768 start_codon:yes stop_codon:yes gene_type:complete